MDIPWVFLYRIRSDESDELVKIEEGIFETVLSSVFAIVGCNWSLCGLCYICYIWYYRRILRGIERNILDQFYVGGKKCEILREYYWESNMRAKVNQFTYNALIYYPTFKAFNPAFIYLIFIPSLSEMDNIKQEIHVRL